MNQIMMQLALIIILMFCSNTTGLMNDYEVDVRCSKKGINVRLAFKTAFHGIIFSKGFHNDENCRYYAENGPGFKIVAFNIPFSSCGTEIELGSLNNITNIIAIQHNPLLETWKDSEVTLSCQSIFPSISDSETHEVNELEASLAMAWMELKSYEENVAINSAAYVGEKIFVIIHVKDDGTFNDIAISNCKAQSSLNVSSEMKFIELLDELGCSTSEKLLSSFNISTSPDGNFIASSVLNVFRFTDEDDLYLSCNVELCEDVCHKFCPQNAEKILSKRSISFTRLVDSHALDSNQNEGKDLTRKLMHLTMNTIASRMKERLSVKESPRVVARNLLLDYDDHDDIDEYSTEESSTAMSTVVPENEQPTSQLTMEHSNLQLTITKKLKVLPTKPNADLHTRESLQSSNECLPRVRFIVPIVLFSLITLCLLITTILMACYIRSERKRSKINNFLLYSYR